MHPTNIRVPIWSIKPDFPTEYSHAEYDLSHTFKEALLYTDQQFFVDQVCASALNVEYEGIGFFAIWFSQMQCPKNGNLSKTIIFILFWADGTLSCLDKLHLMYPTRRGHHSASFDGANTNVNYKTIQYYDWRSSKNSQQRLWHSVKLFPKPQGESYMPNDAIIRRAEVFHIISWYLILKLLFTRLNVWFYIPEKGLFENYQFLLQELLVCG